MSREDDKSPLGSNREGYETKRVEELYLLKHLRAYINEQQGAQRWAGLYLEGPCEMTVHSCWSGYSEYTITNQWSEIEVTWGGYRCYWGNTTAFFKDMAVVNTEGWD